MGSLSASHSVRLGTSGGSSQGIEIPLLLLNSDFVGGLELGLGFCSGLTGRVSGFGLGCGWVQ
jgi:hypothetical protein